MKRFSVFPVFLLLVAVSAVALALPKAATIDRAPAGKQPIPEIIIPAAPHIKNGPKAWSLQEGFEGSWLPAGWDTTRVSGTYATYCNHVTTGTYPTCTPHGGSYMIEFRSWYASSGNREQLITPPVSISNANDSLCFWMVHDPGYSGNNDRIVIEIMTKPIAGSWGSWTAIDSFSRYQASQAWLYHALPLGAYISDSVRISFTGHSMYGNNMYFDDVAVGCEYTPTPLDAGVVSIDSPATAYMPPSVEFHPSYTVKNFGTSKVGPLGGMCYIYDSTGTQVYGDGFVTSDSIGPDSVISFVNTGTFLPAPDMSYQEVVFTTLLGDTYAANDTMKFNFRTFNKLQGNVTDDNNAGAPMAGVAIHAAGPSTYNTTTDGSGHYFFFDMTAGTYTVTASETGYVNQPVAGVIIASNAPATQDITMGYPVIGCTPSDSFYITMPLDTTDNTTWGLAISNTGTRDLNYSLIWPQLTKGGKSFSDSIWSLYNIDAITGSQLNLGVEYALGSIWTTNSGANTTSDANYLVQMDATGSVLNTYTQPAAGNTGYGWRDLCFDGTYLYGSYSGVIDQIDPTTGVVTGTTIPSPQNPGRALAYNPSNDHFYVANFASSIYEIDRTGAIINTWANAKSIYGLAYDGDNPAGPSLWAWSQDGTPTCQATRFDLTSGSYGTETFQAGGTTAVAGGATFTTDLVPGKAVLLGLYQDTPDRLVGHEIRDASVTWLNFAPASGTVTPGNTGNSVVTFNTTGLTDLTTYAAALNIKGNFTTVMTPVFLHTNNAAGVAGNHGTAPKAVFALNANRPNPVQGRTTFSFTLPKDCDYSLRVYNIAGQLVRDFSGKGQLGLNRVEWNTSGYGNGVYFYNLSAGGKQATRKLVVIK